MGKNFQNYGIRYDSFEFFYINIFENLKKKFFQMVRKRLKTLQNPLITPSN